MKTILIYDNGEEYEPNILVTEFESSKKMIEFINKQTPFEILGAYEVLKELQIESYEKVLTYRIKE